MKTAEKGYYMYTTFDVLKRKLIEAPCLRAAHYSKPFHLFTDASSTVYAVALNK